jgi:DNA-directed RNA polymerase subunit RPC12/RpoP
MNNDIKCPKCSEVIKGEKFDFRVDTGAKWYKYTKQNMHCPHCGTRLKYTLKTRSLIYLVGVIFLVTIILATFKLISVYGIVFAPFLTSLLFWKYREICIYE